uniref:Reverse transcriptase RNase H-like domain-containing protein n=1 Tax=Knipowitschia caucasica TaxID=637954 RepID=A0AAV2LRJ9_KNICA
MAKFKPPENFNFEKPGEWPSWRQRFARFRSASKLSLEDADVQAVLMVRQAEEVAQQITQQEQQAPLAVQAVKQKRFVKKGGKPQGERSGGQQHGYQGESKCNRDTAVEMGLVKRVQQVKAAAVHQGTMKTDPVKIQLRDDAVPHAVHTARRVPLPLLSKVQAELQRMEEHGVIVKVTQPTEWCAPMVPVLKPSGAVRICVGLQKLNENLKRETYQLPTTDETLGVWACERFQKYLVGMDKFRLITDHKPLVPLINSKDLDAVPVRCQRLLMRLMRFNAKAEYAPGKTLVISDALSRSPLKESYSTTEAVIASHVNAVTHSWPVSQSKLDRIRTATQEDPQLQHVRKLIRDGWPKRDDPLLALMSYRATPTTSTGVSPAEMLMGRKIRTTLPSRKRNLIPKQPNCDLIRRRDEEAKQQQAFYYNRRHGARDLPPLHTGDHVLSKLDGEKVWKGRASVQQECGTPRSYQVKSPGGGEMRRNRRHLQQVLPPMEEENTDSGQPTTEPEQEAPQHGSDQGLFPVADVQRTRSPLSSGWMLVLRVSVRARARVLVPAVVQRGGRRERRTTSPTDRVLFVSMSSIPARCERGRDGACIRIQTDSGPG